MKFSHTIVSATCLLLATTAFAKSELTCPPISTIQSNANFREVLINIGTVWAMITSPYSYKDASWGTVLVASLPDATSEQDALLQGSQFMKEKVVFSEPKSEERDHNFTCTYAESDEYNVFAGTPYYVIDKDAAKYSKLLHR